MAAGVKDIKPCHRVVDWSDDTEYTVIIYNIHLPLSFSLGSERKQGDGDVR